MKAQKETVKIMNLKKYHYACGLELEVFHKLQLIKIE